MIKFFYIHDHDCSWSKEIIEVRPEVDGGVYYPPTAPHCLDLHVELRRYDKEAENG